jgi:predicted anti-sigma-YlaC factor YlaD
MNPETGPGSCERALLLLSLRADGAATPSQLAEADAHLSACEACRRAAAADAAVAARLRERAGAPEPAWLQGFAARTSRLALATAREARSQNRLLWMSAAAALLVAATARIVLDVPGPAPSSHDDVASARESARLALIRAPRLHRAAERR